MCHPSGRFRHKVLVINGGGFFLASCKSKLTEHGYRVMSASSGNEALTRVAKGGVDLILVTPDLPDLPGTDLLRRLQLMRAAIPIVMVDAKFCARDVVTGFRLGAAEFIEQPVDTERLVRTMERALGSDVDDPDAGPAAQTPSEYAAARWARAVVAVVDAPRDPRTLAGWSRMVIVSSSALRKWCRLVGIRPRRALVFVRLLRATYLNGSAGQNLANVLDITDLRTLDALLAYAGLPPPLGTADRHSRISRASVARGRRGVAGARPAKPCAQTLGPAVLARLVPARQRA